MDKIIDSIYGDNRFQVSNNKKYILVIGMTGVGKSSFVNFITDASEDNQCQVSIKAKPCTAKYKMVDCIHFCGSSYKTLYFVDTPGLNDPKGDKKNIEEILKFRNTFPRINAIIYCQKLDDTRFDQTAKILFNLMKDLYPDPNIFKHLIIVRTKSSRTSDDFKDYKEASSEYITTLKEEYKIDDQLEIKQFYIDSKHRDNDSLNEKAKILDLLCKLDPIFMGIEILKIEEVIIYDSLKNTYEIKEEVTTKYTDYDGSSKISTDTEIEIQDFNGIKRVEVDRKETNEMKKCLWWCKSWKIIYTIYHINLQNQRVKVRESPIWQSKKNEDISDKIKNLEEERLNKLNKIF